MCPNLSSIPVAKTGMKSTGMTVIIANFTRVPNA